MIQTIQYKNKAVVIIDQTRLPARCGYKECRTVRALWQAIKRLEVRGAPALGVAAAYGAVLAVQDADGSRGALVRRLEAACAYLATARPTAVNLFRGLDRVRAIPARYPLAETAELKRLIRAEAEAVADEDRSACRAMGDYGARLIRSGDPVMTICNAGALATVDYGTALGVFYSAHRQGKKICVYACETRPLLQGARLTAWELGQAGIRTILITDNMAAAVMREKKIRAVVVGADRIAANGDAANKIGTYGLAVLARAHRIPFYVAAPGMTVDLSVKNGAGIPIEERSADEVRRIAGRRVAPEGVEVYNPAFDVTPARLITAFITERGIIWPPFTREIKKNFQQHHHGARRGR